MSASLKTYRDVTSVESGLYETCARHTARFISRTLQTAYFCDDCTKRLVVEALNNRPPIYHGETIEGYCGLCNQTREVTMRQWFACGPCWNVILAYQKSIAASSTVHEWWANEIKPLFSHLELEETERVLLTPYARAQKTKIQRAASLSTLDFLVSDKSKLLSLSLFHIEQKTGPGSIESMKEFQLDVNDFNDIAGATNLTKVPSYVFHVQSSQEYSFPTRKTIIRDMWWTDILTLQENQKRIANRRGEDKKAIYYRPSAFKPIDQFTDELKSQGYLKLASKLAKAPITLVS